MTTAHGAIGLWGRITVVNVEDVMRLVESGDAELFDNQGVKMARAKNPTPNKKKKS